MTVILILLLLEEHHLVFCFKWVLENKEKLNVIILAKLMHVFRWYFIDSVFSVLKCFLLYAHQWE